MEDRNLVVISETVSLPIPVAEAIRQWTEYQELTRGLLDDSDYQNMGNRKFKKKSAWRKYARAFNISDRVSYEHVERDATGFPLWARVRVEATAPNGRTAEADHECHVSERCCPAAWGDDCDKRSWSNHKCCREGCTGRGHWSHPGDLVATATTRAKNRAISDLIGAGEVSAEEMDGQRVDDAKAPATQAGGPHWCADHKTEWFMRGKMQSYAHPIDGQKEWCYEPKPPGPGATYWRGQAPVPAGAAPPRTDRQPASPQRAAAGETPPAKDSPTPAPESAPGASHEQAETSADYDTDLTEVQALKQKAGLTDAQLATRIRNRFDNRSFKVLLPAERGEVKDMLNEVIVAHAEADLGLVD